MRSPAFSCAAVAASRVTTHRLGGSVGGVAPAPATMMTGGNRITVVVPARTTTGNMTKSSTVEYGVRRMGTVVASAHQPGGRLVHHIVSCTPLRVDEKARSTEKRIVLIRRVMVCVALAAYGNLAFRAVQRLSSYDG